jgi:hypothetical protein
MANGTKKKPRGKQEGRMRKKAVGVGKAGHGRRDGC